VMQVLLCLAAQAGQVVSKERLLRTVWSDTFVGDDVLTRSISELRRVFGDDVKEPRFIQTIPKSGYRLIAGVSSNAEQDPAAERQDPSKESIPGVARPRGSAPWLLMSCHVDCVDAVSAVPILPRSFHRPRASTDGSSTRKPNKTGVRLWTACSFDEDCCVAGRVFLDQKQRREKGWRSADEVETREVVRIRRRNCTQSARDFNCAVVVRSSISGVREIM
jgi:Transcriptional regulatory protein, C terminal